MNGAIYGVVGIVLFAIGLYALFVRPHVLHKLIAGNVAVSGVFLVLLRSGHGAPDPVSQAMVLTGIVVAVAITGFAAALLVRMARVTGRATLGRSSGP